MLRRVLIVLAAVVVVGAIGLYGAWRYYQAASADPAFFEEAIRAFESADRAAPPEPGAIVFVGSSSIRMWDGLERDMAPLRVLERGFGGAHLAHVVHNARRIVLPYTPQAVVVYAGDNDLAEGSGKSVADVVADFETLVALLRAERPDLPIYFITIKPSRLRWDRWDEMDRANDAIAALAADDPHLAILDIATPMLAEADGPPPDSLFLLDGLHLSDAGYAIWTDVIRGRAARRPRPAVGPVTTPSPNASAPP